MPCARTSPDRHVRTLADAAARADLLARLDRLTPDHAPAWGRFTAPQMLAHLADALRMAFGEVSCTPKRVPLVRHFPVKHLALYVLPFPRNAPTARELLARAPESFDAERAQLARLVARFDPAVAPAAWGPHPLFGSLSGAQWGVLAQRHADHHLRQFGV